MEKRIELEKRHRKPDQLRELNLDNCRSTTVEGLTEEFSNLEVLSLNGVGLTSLKGFPGLPKLRKLELSDNRIAGGLQALKACARLATLNLSNNKIKDLETLEPLKELVSLKSLDLYRNDVTQVEEYRTKVFELLPELQFLDGTDRNNKEADESDLEDEEGKELNGAGDEDEEESEDEAEVQGEEDDSDDDGDDEEAEDEDVEEEGEEDEEDEDEVGLKALYNDNLKDDDGDDYVSEEESEEDDEDLDSTAATADGSLNESAEAEGGSKRGVKRPHEGSDEEDD